MSVPYIHLADDRIATVRRIRTLFPEQILPFGFVVEFTVTRGERINTRLLWEARVTSHFPPDFTPRDWMQEAKQVGLEILKYAVANNEINHYMLLGGTPNLRVIAVGHHGAAEHYDFGAGIFQVSLAGDWQVNF